MTSGCHVDRTGAAKSPEACNTCHGDFRAPAADAIAAAPPRSLDGSTAETAPGVGAHQKHLVTGTLGKSVKCAECHRIPAVWDAAGHIDADMRAEVVFTDTLANLTTGDGTLKPVPSYDRATSSCNNVYCHGNWRIRRATSAYQFAYTDSAIVGAKYSPRWTAGAAGASCGLCHAIPPGGHTAYESSACGTCHTGIADAAGKIIDRNRHINGKTIIFSVENPFR
jgi:predicted CxxxxCH...CXXCH cytochrome family protein